jgi:hypothetical protein
MKPDHQDYKIIHLKTIACPQCPKVGTGVAIFRSKAPFSSPVAGSGKPFLPSLTLPVIRDFFCPESDPKSNTQ